MRAAAEEPPDVAETNDVTTGEVEGDIKTLRNKTTPGLDRIENEVLKAASDVLAPRLAEIFRKFLALGVA